MSSFEDYSQTTLGPRLQPALVIEKSYELDSP